MYGGAKLLRALWHISATLKDILCSTGNQCKAINFSLVLSLRDNLTMRAERFMTRCKRSISLWGRLINRLLQ